MCIRDSRSSVPRFSPSPPLSLSLPPPSSARVLAYAAVGYLISLELELDKAMLVGDNHTGSLTFDL
eukprot:3894668-Rhodomonas_salina.3